MLTRILALAALMIMAGMPMVAVAQPADAQLPGQRPAPGPSGPAPGPSGPSSGPVGPGSSPGSPSPSGASLWGAIAFTADGSYATAWKQPSKSEAEADVSKRCARMGRGACEVISFPGNLCGALANFRSGRYRAAYTGGGATSPEAQRAATDRCNDDRRANGRCQLRTVVCGDGR
jgi:Domain of unknown function (DUF4189)